MFYSTPTFYRDAGNGYHTTEVGRLIFLRENSGVESVFGRSQRLYVPKPPREIGNGVMTIDMIFINFFAIFRHNFDSFSIIETNFLS